LSKILITGGAGFIGYHAAKALAGRGGGKILCIDNLNDYYDVRLKYARLADLGLEPDGSGAAESARYPGLRFLKADVADRERIATLFRDEAFDYVLHLAAQAGVRYSLQNPHAYIESNIVGFLNVLEGCRHFPVRHLVYASSSSVYGLNREIPFAEDHSVDHPASLYACTKKTDELMAHTYGHLFGIPSTGLRFFTVYGPWGRPDMAYFSFTEKILRDLPIDIFNRGEMYRDFTYVDDIVDGVCAVLPLVPEPISDPASRSVARCAVYNLGNNDPVALGGFVETLEALLGVQARKNLLPMQPGDVVETYADISKIQGKGIFTPKTDLKTGLKAFVDWYRTVYVNLK